MLRVSRLVSYLFLLATVSVVLAACGKKEASQSAGPIPVSILQLQAKSLPFVMETVGRTEGSQEVELRARVSGILEKRVYAEGSVVRAGAVLFRIDQAPFQIALEQARATLAQEQARNNQARRNAERIKELLAKNLVSHNDADAAISAMEVSDAAILSAQANVRQAQLNLSYTQVVAPIGGIAGRALHSDGSLVTAGTDSGLLTTVTQANPIWARFALSAAEYDGLRSATVKNTVLAVELLLADGSVYPQKGHVNFTGSTLDPSLGTVPLRAEFPNSGLTVLPGEYVRVRVTGGVQDAITVPQTAVLQGAKGPYVWIANGQGEAEQRLVKTGVWIGDEWRITSGLAAGDSIIVDNLLKVKPGVKLKSTQAVKPLASQK
jgi:membrane fusion protein (multidrug efflux system)